MTTFDWAIVALVLLLGLRGLGAGFLVGALSLGGTLAGLYLGSRVASSLLVEGLPHGGGSLIFLFVVLMSALLGEAIARPVGQRLRARVLGTFLESLDRLGGAILGAAARLLLAWAVGVVGQQAPLPPAIQSSVQRSEILGQLDERLPSRTPLQAFSRFDPLPRIEGPRPEVPAPDAALLDDWAVQRAAPSVVRVTGIGDGFGSAGSGWVAAPNLVVTIAHVVAGTEYTAVQPGGVGNSCRPRSCSSTSVTTWRCCAPRAWTSRPYRSPPPNRGKRSPSSGIPRTARSARAPGAWAGPNGFSPATCSAGGPLNG